MIRDLGYISANEIGKEIAASVRNARYIRQCTALSAAITDEVSCGVIGLRHESTYIDLLAVVYDRGGIIDERSPSGRRVFQHVTAHDANRVIIAGCADGDEWQSG